MSNIRYSVYENVRNSVYNIRKTNVVSDITLDTQNKRYSKNNARKIYAIFCK